MKNGFLGFFLSRRRESKLAFRGEKKRNSGASAQIIFRDEKKQKYTIHDEEKRNSVFAIKL